MIVVADTSPLHYLVLIGAADVLPKLYGEVIIPAAVVDELLHARAPEEVRRWARELPLWVHVRNPTSVPSDLVALGRGEAHAIALGSEIQATLMLLDDRAARRLADAKRLTVIGTVGILESAAKSGLIDSRATLRRLCATNFRIDPRVLADTLERLG